jgi:exopolyphosphatase/guanosine-5'-triphosphate,3'-diphosphate pyrophosphatase
MKLGAVRLTQMFFPKFELSVEKIERCKTYINAIIKSVANDILKTGFELCAGTSGSFRSVISILQKQEYDFNASYNNESFSFNELAEVADHILVRRTKNDRMQIIGMEPRRADIIPAGVLILKSIFEQLHIKKVIYSDFALREGVLIDTIQRLKTIEPFVND